MPGPHAASSSASAADVAEQAEAGRPVDVRVEEAVLGVVEELVGEDLVLRLAPDLVRHRAIIACSSRGAGVAGGAFVYSPHMFDALSDRFDGIFSKLRSRGKLTEADIDAVAREIRLALLEADVNVKVVKSLIARVKERANGAEVQKSLSPAQQVIKIVHEELITTLGGTSGKLTMSSKPPTS